MMSVRFCNSPFQVQHAQKQFLPLNCHLCTSVISNPYTAQHTGILKNKVFPSSFSIKFPIQYNFQTMTSIHKLVQLHRLKVFTHQGRIFRVFTSHINLFYQTVVFIKSILTQNANVMQHKSDIIFLEQGLFFSALSPR